MKRKILYFFLSNIIAASTIYLKLLDNNANLDKLLHVRDIIGGIDIYLAIVVGLVVSSFRFALIRSESDRTFSKGEKLLLLILSLFAWAGYFLMAHVANIMLFGDSNELGDWIINIISILGFWLIFVENYFIHEKSTMKTTKVQKQVINLFTVFYVSSGISASWNYVMFEMFKYSKSPLGILLIILLCFIVLIPFQRHFWFELMLASKSRKDNVLVIAVLIITVILAIIPVLILY